jgi:replicative DNA helicase
LEAQVLGAWITLPGWHHENKTVLTEDLFAVLENRQLARALAEFGQSASPPFNLVHLAEFCARTLGGDPQRWGMLISKYAVEAPASPAQADRSLELLVSYYNRRLLYEAGGELVRAAAQNITSPQEALGLFDTIIQERREQLALTTQDLILSQPHRHYLEWAQSPTKMLRMGMSNLDALLEGISPGELVIVAARPGVGKTALLLSAAINMAKEGIKVGIISLEMHPLLIVARVLSNVCTIPISAFRNRPISDKLAQEVEERLKGFPIENLIIFNKIPHTIEAIAGCVEEAVRRGARCVMIDYLQLIGISTSYSREDRRDLELGYITSRLKRLAVDKDIAIILASQLNRMSEQRGDKRPMLADLRDSGSIEQDADIVMLLFRPEMYGIKTYRDGTPTENICEVIVAKHRNGALGVAKLYFSKPYVRFHSVESTTPPQPPKPQGPQSRETAPKKEEPKSSLLERFDRFADAAGWDRGVPASPSKDVGSDTQAPVAKQAEANPAKDSSRTKDSSRKVVTRDSRVSLFSEAPPPRPPPQ